MAHELHQQYPSVVTSPGAAREDITDYLADYGLADLTAVATLLVSELVTNALVHAEGVIAMHARWSGLTLHVDIHDCGANNAGASRLEEPPELAVSGRGLAIVDSLATTWGTHESNGAGRNTWFELKRA